MIRMIKGTYGLVKNGTVEPMTKHSPAFSINAAREAELVEAGVAVYEAEPESTFSEYNGMNMTELREAAAAYGVDASAVRSKKECRGGTLRQGAAAEREQVRPIRILFQVTYDRICSRQHFDTINTKGNHVGRYRFCV